MPLSTVKKNMLVAGFGVLFAGALYLFYTYDPAIKANQVFPKCPTKSLLNIYCPGCGSQRAIHQLLHGNLQRALRYNPLMVLLAPVAIVMILQFVLRHYFNYYLKINLFYKTWFSILLGVLFIVYFISRNIPLPAFQFLQPPN